MSVSPSPLVTVCFSQSNPCHLNAKNPINLFVISCLALSCISNHLLESMCFFWFLDRNSHDVCMFDAHVPHSDYFVGVLYTNVYSILFYSILFYSILLCSDSVWSHKIPRRAQLEVPWFYSADLNMFAQPVCLWKISSLYSILVKQRAALISCACLSDEASLYRRHWSSVKPFESQLARYKYHPNISHWQCIQPLLLA